MKFLGNELSNRARNSPSFERLKLVCKYVPVKDLTDSPLHKTLNRGERNAQRLIDLQLKIDDILQEDCNINIFQQVFGGSEL